MNESLRKVRCRHYFVSSRDSRGESSKLHDAKKSQVTQRSLFLCRFVDYRGSLLLLSTIMRYIDEL